MPCTISNQSNFQVNFVSGHSKRTVIFPAYHGGHQNWPDSRGKRNKWLLFAFAGAQTDSQIAVPLRVPVSGHSTHMTCHSWTLPYILIYHISSYPIYPHILISHISSYPRIPISIYQYPYPYSWSLPYILISTYISILTAQISLPCRVPDLDSAILANEPLAFSFQKWTLGTSGMKIQSRSKTCTLFFISNVQNQYIPDEHVHYLN